MSSRPDDREDDARWRSAGDRIQTLVEASSAGGAAARQRAEQLVREVTDLYGAGLERMLRTALAVNPELAQAFVDDDLVASLLLVHGLHPHNVERRVADALDSVRPYLGSHGGDVHLLDVSDGVVRLQFSGSCKTCPSSAVTLELAVEDAVRAAAPEVSSIEVVAADKVSDSGVIPAESLLTRVHADGPRHAVWRPVPELAELARGEVGGFSVAGVAIVACRIDDSYYAYRDRCPACSDSMAGARLSAAELRCPRCKAAFDVVHAGAGVDDSQHLEPVPVLARNGVPSVAVAAEEVAS